MLKFREAMETPKKLNDAASLIVVLALLTFVVSVGTFILVKVNNAR